MSESNILDELLALPNESEWVEFKHNNSTPKQIGEYISALANSAVIQKKEMAYMIWGIENGTKKVLGTTFDPSTEKRGNQALEMWLSQRLQPTPHFEFSCVNYKSKSVVVLSIRPVREQPVKFENLAYIKDRRTQNKAR